MSAIGFLQDDLRSKQPTIYPWLARRLLAGWRPEAIAAAAGGAISVRTAYRWRRELVGLELVRVGGYVATFALRRTRQPIRLTPWVPAAPILAGDGAESLAIARPRGAHL